MKRIYPHHDRFYYCVFAHLIRITESIAVLGHNRYSTAGMKGAINCVQPFVVHTAIGLIAIAHNGELVDAKQRRKQVNFFLHYSICYFLVFYCKFKHLINQSNNRCTINEVHNFFSSASQLNLLVELVLKLMQY